MTATEENRRTVLEEAAEIYELYTIALYDLEGKLVQGVSGDDALPVDHVGPAGPAQVDAADDVIEGVILIDAHQIEDGLPVLLYGHPHLDAQLAFINRIGDAVAR